MKTLVAVCKWLVGLLFIFSGLVKANDPLGLSYKMQEFFEAWGFNFLHNYTLSFSICMNVLEVVAGVAIIVGWKPKFFSRLLLLLIAFFTFLTAYVLFSGKIKACGCFGDCIPLTPAQTFTKDIILCVLILVIVFNVKKITPLFKSATALSVVILSLVAASGLQWYALHYLPLADCLPYKKGNNIIEQMKAPKGSVPDSIEVVTLYKKDGKTIKVLGENFPPDFDSTYEYIDRKDEVIRKGNAEPPIKDFTLMNIQGIDTTQAIFTQTNKYILIFVKDFGAPQNTAEILAAPLIEKFQKQGLAVYIVTSDVEGAKGIFIKNVTILTCDGTVLKTAARVNSTFFLMQGSTILNKLSYKNAAQLIP